MAKLDRYHNLLKAVELTTENAKSHKPWRFMEIGVYDGRHAEQVIRHAIVKGRTNVEYYGFDLFELATKEDQVREVGKSKLAPSMADAYKRLSATGAKVKLQIGSTTSSLPASVPNLPLMDLIFIDGGHSLETIANDWFWAHRIMGDKTVLIFDDLYPGDLTKGAVKLVQEISDFVKYSVQLLDPVDEPKPGFKIMMAQVTRTQVPVRLAYDFYERLGVTRPPHASTALMDEIVPYDPQKLQEIADHVESFRHPGGTGDLPGDGLRDSGGRERTPDPEVESADRGRRDPELEVGAVPGPGPTEGAPAALPDQTEEPDEVLGVRPAESRRARRQARRNSQQ